MARQLRVEFPGAICHVTCRMIGDGRIERSPLFVDDKDRERLLDRLQDRVARYGVRLYQFCEQELAGLRTRRSASGGRDAKRRQIVFRRLTPWSDPVVHALQNRGSRKRSRGSPSVMRPVDMAGLPGNTAAVSSR
jgi:hypothetical protein